MNFHAFLSLAILMFSFNLSADFNELLSTKKTYLSERLINCQENPPNPTEVIETVIHYGDGMEQIEKLSMLTKTSKEKMAIKKVISELQAQYMSFKESTLKKLDDEIFKANYFKLIESGTLLTNKQSWIQYIILNGERLAKRESSHLAYQSLLIQLKFIRDTCIQFGPLGGLTFALGDEMYKFTDELSAEYLVRAHELKSAQREKELFFKSFLDKFRNAMQLTASPAQISLLLAIVFDRTNLSKAKAGHFFDHQVAVIMRAIVDAGELLMSCHDEELKKNITKNVKRMRGGVDVETMNLLMPTLREDEQSRAREVVAYLATFNNADALTSRGF